jgi:hypothetical protein
MDTATATVLAGGVGAFSALLAVGLGARFSKSSDHAKWQKDHLLPAAVALLGASRERSNHVFAHTYRDPVVGDIDELHNIREIVDQIKVLAPVLQDEADWLWRCLDATFAVARGNTSEDERGAVFRAVRGAEHVFLVGAQRELGLRPSFLKRIITAVWRRRQRKHRAGPIERPDEPTIPPEIFGK